MSYESLEINAQSERPRRWFEQTKQRYLSDSAKIVTLDLTATRKEISQVLFLSYFSASCFEIALKFCVN